MSRYQSRAEKSESTQYKKTGRSVSFNQQHHFGSGRGGGGFSAPSNTFNPSLKKNNSSAQGGQFRARSPNVSLDSSNLPLVPIVQNGSHQQQSSLGKSDAPTPNPSMPSSFRHTGAPNPNITGAVPISNSAAAPFSNISTIVSDSQSATSPSKGPGDSSRSFPLQFGSISPGSVNGMQIPARTSSAPPNLDEQKRDKDRQKALRAAPAVPIPSIPKHHFPKKEEASIADQPNPGEAQQIPKFKGDVHVSSPIPVTQTQNSSPHSTPGMPVQVPVHQSQVPVHFGGSNPQIQSHPMPGASFPMPMHMSMPMPMHMPLSMGNHSVQQSMFVPGLHAHPMQSQGMMHQGQSLNLSSQMGPQIPPQLAANIGMNMAPQFPHQPAGKYSSSRKTVKITHPETHEELRFDGSSASRTHSNVPSQSQPILSFPPTVPMNYYPGPYSATTPLFFPSVSSVPLNSAQSPSSSQSPRFYNQVTVKPAGISLGDKDTLLPSSSPSAEKGEPSKLLRSQEGSTLHGQKEFESSPAISLQMSKPSSESDTASGPVNVKNDVPDSVFSDVALIDDSESISCCLAGEVINGTAIVPGSVKDKHKIPGDSGQQNQNFPMQVDVQSCLPSQFLGAKALDTKSSDIDVVLETAKEPLSKTIPITSEASASTSIDAGERKPMESSKSFGAKGVKNRQSKPEAMGRKEHREAILSESSIPKHSFEASLQCGSVESLQIMGKVEEIFDQEVKTTTGGFLEQAQQSPEESLRHCSDDVQVGDNLVISTSMTDGGNDKSSMPKNDLSEQDDRTSTSDASVSVPDSTNARETTVTECAMVDHESSPLIDPISSADGMKQKSEDTENNGSGLVSPLSSIKEKVFSDPDAGKSTAEISTPKLKSPRNKNQGGNGAGNELLTNRYSRDFLFKFAEHCTDLPVSFEITSDMLDLLMVSTINALREPYPSPGRNMDRPIGGSRPNRRGSGIAEEDKWSKLPGPLVLGQGDVRANVGYAGNIVGFPPGQGGNYGVLRNPRSVAPIQYAGGILSGPMQPLGPQGGMQRNNSDSERWQRGTGFQKGLMPSPLTPLQVMHKAEKKYEVGKVSDEEEAKQRQLKAILNKLTPQNFEKLFEQVKQADIDNVVTLAGVISQIFDKALMEPTFCEMYANFCFHLAADLPDLSVENEKITFKRLLLNKCQEEFERGEREEEEANKADEEGEVKQTIEEREEKRLRARRRMLGNIRLIGELYKKRMLTERIMHSCINKSLGQYDNPDEENIEALCKLMSTIGEVIDHPKAKEHIDAYFDIMLQMSNNMKLSSRVRFMLKDSIDLRKNNWQQRRKIEGPKKIEEVHRDAAQERHAQASRLARAPSFSTSVRRGPPVDFPPRGPGMLSSPNSQMGGFRALPPQLRASGSQDIRMEACENRTTSVPLPQRPLGDDSLTLGPQGGLARGMAFRGQPSAPNISVVDVPSPADARRAGSGANGFSSTAERTVYGQREDIIPKYEADGYDQSHPRERSTTYGNREIRNEDRNSDRSMLTSPPSSVGPLHTIESNSEKVWPEERLRDMSMATIKEFYSVKDENEVTSCIKDLNAPSFYSSMISIWVTDSFERKDVERDLLTKLLVSLAKSRTVISEDQLVKGFESVLAILEDTVNDAPRAAEFLGRIFAKIILEKIISLSEIGRLIFEGGEEQGRLVQIGIAAEVLGSLLEMIKSEKGDSVLKEIHSGSNLRLENFRPPGSNKCRKIDKFI